jgi:two-component system, response regulator
MVQLRLSVPEPAPCRVLDDYPLGAARNLVRDRAIIEGAVQILLIEDNLEYSNRVLKAVRRRKLANWTQVARNGTEALEFHFRTGAYARRSNHTSRLILLDLKLPEVNGLEVLQRIKAEPTTRCIAVAILSSSQE